MKKERKKGDRREQLKTCTVACNHATSYAKRPKGLNQSQASKYNSIRITPEIKNESEPLDKPHQQWQGK